VRTVFLGTSEFAVAVLRRLVSSDHRPVLVVTRPDRPRGRGRQVTPPPVAQAAAQLDLELEQPESVNDQSAWARIALAQPEVLCVCAFGGLIREPLLSSYRMLNVHPSLLPRWRGAAPIERAIMAGDEATGVSIMQVTAGLDNGPVCLQTVEPISAQDTYGTLAARLAPLGGDLLVRALSEHPPCREQDESLVTYAEKISAEDRRLDPGRPAAALERLVRALTPHVGAYLELQDGARLGVSEAQAVDRAQRGVPEGVLDIGEGVPSLVCASGALQLRRVKPPGRREMSGQAWLRGLRS
jgi:methionyl-tRNA formyltransferase